MIAIPGQPAVADLVPLVSLTPPNRSPQWLRHMADAKALGVEVQRFGRVRVIRSCDVEQARAAIARLAGLTPEPAGAA
jgi:hypothetical protein